MTQLNDPIKTFAESLKIQESQWLRQALTHSSFLNENPDLSHGHNERLEFLGDAVLSLCVSHLLSEFFPNAKEGKLSKIRSMLVNEASLAKLSKRIGVGDILFLGRGEEQSGGREKPSLLADAYEAILAAIYLEEGFEKAFGFIRSQMMEEFEEIRKGRRRKDYKTRLQEVFQHHMNLVPLYEIQKTKGPDHAKTFYVTLTVEKNTLTEGIGRSKKEAEQNAAKNALLILESLEE